MSRYDTIKEIIFDAQNEYWAPEAAHAAVQAIIALYAEEVTLEERGLMRCPFCDGDTGPAYDESHKLEPAYVNLCPACMGMGYMHPGRFMRSMVDTPEDYELAADVARLTDEEQEWL